MNEAEKPATPTPTLISDPPKPVTIEEIIKEKAPEVLEAIPEKNRAVLAQLTYEKHEISMRSSPLPPPEELDAYNKIIPNGADRIMKMVEAQSSHRIELEKKVVTSQQNQAHCGQIFALVIGLVGLALATYAATHGQPIFGGVIGGSTLVSLVTAFLVTRGRQRKELSAKRNQMEVVPQSAPPKNKAKKGRKH
jgi:uncharacterized membrane protein